jgi:hypothetical protein
VAEENDRPQDAPGVTIITSHDLRVDLIRDTDDYSGLMIDCGATLITSILVSQCH